jgi:hypothetical protein
VHVVYKGNNRIFKRKKKLEFRIFFVKCMTSLEYKSVNKQTHWVRVRRVFKVRKFRTRTRTRTRTSEKLCFLVHVLILIIFTRSFSASHDLFTFPKPVKLRKTPASAVAEQRHCLAKQTTNNKYKRITHTKLWYVFTRDYTKWQVSAFMWPGIQTYNLVSCVTLETVKLLAGNDYFNDKFLVWSQKSCGNLKLRLLCVVLELDRGGIGV